MDIRWLVSSYQTTLVFKPAPLQVQGTDEMKEQSVQTELTVWVMPEENFWVQPA